MTPPTEEEAPRSLHDQTDHAAMIREVLGEDLWFKADGEPRLRMNDQHIRRSIRESHPVAGEVISRFARLLPPSTRRGKRVWNNYGLLKPTWSEIVERAQRSERGHDNPPLSRSHLMNHVFGVESVLPSFRNETEFDMLLMDVDVQVDGLTMDLFLLDDAERFAILSPWSAAMDSLGLSAEWVMSGYRGFWIHVFWEEPGSREDITVIRDRILAGVGEVRVDEHGRRILEFGRFQYMADDGSLGTAICRLPWSYHQKTFNVSVHVDPATGRRDFLQFMRTDENAGSPAGASSRLPCPPAHRGHVLQIEWDEDDPDNDLTWSDLDPDLSGFVHSMEEVQEMAEEMFALLEHPPAPPAYCGCVCQHEGGLEKNEIESESDPQAHLRWSWEDIIEEAEGRTEIGLGTDWTSSIATGVPDGSKWRVIANGNIALVSARMKWELGFVDWELIKSEYDRHYSSSDQSSGGTVSDWIDRWRHMTRDGADIIPCSPGLTLELVERCRRHAHEVVSSIEGRRRRPKEEDLFHVLLVLLRLAGGRDEFEASTDFIARRSGINPFPTWEEQVDEEGALHDREGERIAARHHPSSEKARDRLLRVMGYVVDLKPDVITGKPFRRTETGSHWKMDERVIKAGRPVGSTYRLNRDHPLWKDE